MSRIDQDVLCTWEDVSSQKKAITVIKNFTGIADTAHDAICSLNPERKITYWNPTAVNLYGYTADEAAGNLLEELISIRKNSELHQAIQKVFINGEKIVNMITRTQGKKGQAIEVLINLFPFIDDTGQTAGACMIAKDITETKRNRSKIQEDEHFISHILDTTPDIIYIMDLHTRQIIYANRQVASDLGYSREQILSMKNPILDIMHPEDKELMKDHMNKITLQVSENKVLEIQYRLKAADGHFEWYCDRNAVFKRNKSRSPVEKIGICQNITVRKKDEELRKTTQEIINQAEEVVNLGSWEYEPTSSSMRWSDGMYRLFNLEKGRHV